MRSIELGWLSRHDKDLPLPELVFASRLAGCSGYYARPGRCESFVGGKGFDLTGGLIVCGETDAREAANTIAHEWRHHWQIFHMGLKDSLTRFNETIDYDSAIREFFKDWREMDALLFSHRRAPSPISHSWMELIKCPK